MLVVRPGQRPVTHRAHPTVVWGEPLPTIAGHTQYAVPHAAGFVSVDFHYEPPASEAPGLQACSEGHAVVVCKIRYIGFCATHCWAT